MKSSIQVSTSEYPQRRLLTSASRAATRGSAAVQRDNVCRTAATQASHPHSCRRHRRAGARMQRRPSPDACAYRCMHRLTRGLLLLLTLVHHSPLVQPPRYGHMGWNVIAAQGKGRSSQIPRCTKIQSVRKAEQNEVKSWRAWRWWRKRGGERVGQGG